MTFDLLQKFPLHRLKILVLKFSKSFMTSNSSPNTLKTCQFLSIAQDNDVRNWSHFSFQL